MGEQASLERMQNEGYTDIHQQVQFRTNAGVIFRADFVAAIRRVV
jgi:hypothetical protein